MQGTTAVVSLWHVAAVVATSAALGACYPRIRRWVIGYRVVRRLRKGAPR